MATIEDFAARFAATSSDPYEVTKLLLEGIVTLELDAALGERMIALVCGKDQVSDDGSKLRDRDVIRRLAGSKDIGRSYVGANHRDAYAWDGTLAPSFDREYSANHQGVDYPEAGRAKLFVRCGGADTPRPLELRKNARGEWKVMAWSSLTVGVRKSATAVGDF